MARKKLPVQKKVTEPGLVLSEPLKLPHPLPTEWTFEEFGKLFDNIKLTDACRAKTHRGIDWVNVVCKLACVKKNTDLLNGIYTNGKDLKFLAHAFKNELKQIYGIGKKAKRSATKPVTGNSTADVSSSHAVDEDDSDHPEDDGDDDVPQNQDKGPSFEYKTLMNYVYVEYGKKSSSPMNHQGQMLFSVLTAYLFQYFYARTTGNSQAATEMTKQDFRVKLETELAGLYRYLGKYQRDTMNVIDWEGFEKVPIVIPEEYRQYYRDPVTDIESGFSAVIAKVKPRSRKVQGLGLALSHSPLSSPTPGPLSSKTHVVEPARPTGIGNNPFVSLFESQIGKSTAERDEYMGRAFIHKNRVDELKSELASEEKLLRENEAKRDDVNLEVLYMEQAREGEKWMRKLHMGIMHKKGIKPSYAAFAKDAFSLLKHLFESLPDDEGVKPLTDPILYKLCTVNNSKVALDGSVPFEETRRIAVGDESFTEEVKESGNAPTISLTGLQSQHVDSAQSSGSAGTAASSSKPIIATVLPSMPIIFGTKEEKAVTSDSHPVNTSPNSEVEKPAVGGSTKSIDGIEAEKSGVEELLEVLEGDNTPTKADSPHNYDPISDFVKASTSASCRKSTSYRREDLLGEQAGPPSKKQCVVPISAKECVKDLIGEISSDSDDERESRDNRENEKNRPDLTDEDDDIDDADLFKY